MFCLDIGMLMLMLLISIPGSLIVMFRLMSKALNDNRQGRHTSPPTRLMICRRWPSIWVTPCQRRLLFLQALMRPSILRRMKTIRTLCVENIPLVWLVASEVANIAQ